jgi:hypothetical protein
MVPREAISGYVDARKSLRLAWESFDRGDSHQVYVRCREAMVRVMDAALVLGGQSGGEDRLIRFLTLMGSEIPLHQAAQFDAILSPPILSSPPPGTREGISSSVDRWLRPRTASRGEVLNHLTMAETAMGLAVKAMERGYPEFREMIAGKG